MKFENHINEAFSRLYEIIIRLRGPQGCAWDREQTASSLRSNLLEECYECIDAIDRADIENLKEELGDLFLLVAMISRICEEEGNFTLKEVFETISEKLVRRHPHVFGDIRTNSVPEIISRWEEIKENEKGKSAEASALDIVPRSLPPLARAFFIQNKVKKVGFDWNDVKPVWEKIEEEILELKSAVESQKKPEIEEEIGDLLFTVVNLSRMLHVDPSIALHQSNKKFVSRFRQMECRMRDNGLILKEASLTQMDEVWEKIKKEEA